MIRETHEKLRPVLERRDHGFRWRGTEISRIEGLSDAVFAVAVTLLVVSLEAPKTFGDLTRLMHGFVSFGYVYPLKFLFTVFTNGITGYRETDASGHTIHAMQSADWRPLMEIYSAGFMALYVILRCCTGMRTGSGRSWTCVRWRSTRRAAWCRRIC